MQGLIRVLQGVTISLLSRVRPFPPSKAARPSSCSYSPKCPAEGKFPEVGLPLYGVLRSSPRSLRALAHVHELLRDRYNVHNASVGSARRCRNYGEGRRTTLRPSSGGLDRDQGDRSGYGRGAAEWGLDRCGRYPTARPSSPGGAFRGTLRHRWYPDRGRAPKPRGGRAGNRTVWHAPQVVQRRRPRREGPLLVRTTAGFEHRDPPRDSLWACHRWQHRQERPTQTIADGGHTQRLE